MDKTFNAEPTKEFFISMLVRDINLRDAIGDLVDNCIDGALNLREDRNFSGLFIHITIDEDHFKISDNCGGIDFETAKSYAFRFGRPEEVKETKYSIGQFGIGMKRALFKMGNEFTVNSKATDNSFKMNVDVREWSKNEDDWSFPYQEKEEFDPPISVEDTGTTIYVNALNEDVKSAFADTIFKQTLQNELELDQLYNINRGLKITFNDIVLKAKRLKFDISEKFKIGHWEENFANGVKVKLMVGVSESNQDLGGWYIFCNDRLIVGPETTELTGWTGRGKGGVANYHHQYYRFRGYAFFSSEDSEKLPWNTTKTGMNPDSPIFKSVRGQMIEMMKSVINGFLNPLKKENESDYSGEKVLNSALEDTHQINIATTKNIEQFFAEDKSFTHPVPDTSRSRVPEGDTRIKYSADKHMVNKAKKVLKVNTNAEVGSLSFMYFVENEIGLDE
jgi:hypothetical protein